MPRLFLTVFTALSFVVLSVALPSTAQDEAQNEVRPDVPEISEADIATAKSIIDTLTLAKKNNDAQAYLKAARAAASLDGEFTVGDTLSQDLTVNDMLVAAKAAAPNDEQVKAEVIEISKMLQKVNDKDFEGTKKVKVCAWKVKWGFDRRGRFKGKSVWTCFGRTIRRF